MYMMSEFWQKHKAAICVSSAIVIVCCIVGLVMWLSDKSSDPPDEQSGKKPDDTMAAESTESLTPLKLPATVQYDNGRDKYTVNYPVGSVSYKNISGDLPPLIMPQFILPPGAPAQIFYNKTTKYATTADVSVISNGQQIVMPAGSMVQLETTINDKTVFCTWSGEHTLWFIANRAEPQVSILNYIYQMFRDTDDEHPDKVPLDPRDVQKN
jgi:hypothetical protein